MGLVITKLQKIKCSDNLILVGGGGLKVKTFQVQGKNVLVIGSQTPWIESLLISQGANHVTTFDYIKIESEHPQTETLLPPEMSNKFSNGVRYDLMVTFSSIEHSGLGRYVVGSNFK